MFTLSRKVNQSILIGQCVMLKVIQMTSDSVVLHATTTGVNDIFPEELLANFHLNKITIDDFIAEKSLTDKKITLKMNEALLMGKDGCIRVANINAQAVTFDLDFPPDIKICKQERLKNQLFNYRSTTCSF